MRQATVERKTRETEVTATVNLDGAGRYDVATGIGFLDHMLEQRTTTLSRPEAAKARPL